MLKYEYKNCNSSAELQVKSIDTGGRTVTFYAAAFCSVDFARAVGDLAGRKIQRRLFLTSVRDKK